LPIDVQRPEAEGAPVRAPETDTRGADLRELVVCSLEPWDDIWRRNQFLVRELLRRNTALRVLFVEPPTDLLHDLSRRRRPELPSLRGSPFDARLKSLRPLKLFPRRFGVAVDELLLRQVQIVVRLMRFTCPVLWLNDVTYAPLIERTRWPSLYDITDDWLLAPFVPRELERLRRLDGLALAHADEVVVCSPALAESRGRVRPVSLVPNGVDIDHFRRPHPRPTDLPHTPTAVYVGSLHDARLDAELVGELADALPQLSVILVGPDVLGVESHQLLAARPNVYLLGPRSYENVPAYLQHADVVIAPHRVSPFTESLDPIKAYECLAVETPTVATRVAGFRDHPTAFRLAERGEFVERVAKTISDNARVATARSPAGWDQRARMLERALLDAYSQRRS
jgi:glycosyltransferase involved in cell wall biosynthesis